MTPGHPGTRESGSGDISRRTFLIGAAAAGLLASCSKRSATTRAIPTSGPGSRTLAANIVYWDQPAGFASLRRHPGLFGQVSPMWYSPDRGSAVVPADDEYTRIDRNEVRDCQSRGEKVIPTLVNMRNGEWNPALVTSMLSSSATRDQHVRAIVELIDRESYDGVDIDYEQLRAEDRESYSGFLRELSKPLHDSGKLLVSGVYAKESEPGPEPHNIAQDYAAIGEACDQVRIQTYDYHYEDSDPGPLAPLQKVRQTLNFAVTAIPANKIIMGVMLLGYDWPGDGSGASVTYEQAMSTARQYKSPIHRETPEGSPTFSYSKEDSGDHQVWFEDATSTRAKLALAAQYRLGGAFFWRLGGEDPATWTLPELEGTR